MFLSFSKLEAKLTVFAFLYLQGAGTDEGCLIEILASRSTKDIRDINAAYKLSMFWII